MSAHHTVNIVIDFEFGSCKNSCIVKAKADHGGGTVYDNL